MSDKIKKLICLILASMLWLLLASGCGKASSKKTDTVNVMVVMDVSSSMSKTDPSGCARFASNMLVSAFDDYKVPLVSSENISSGASIGVITYGKEAHEVIPLTKLKDADQKTYGELRKKIDSIEYDDSSGTNYYAGLEKAMDICEKNPAGENIIFLLSDGQFALNDPKVDEKKQQRDYIAKYNNKLNAMPNCTIYTVGIDTSGDTESDKYFEDLKQLSTFDEEGKQNHYIVKENTAALTDMFAGFIEDIYKVLNPGADKIVAIPEIDGSECTFTLDKRYKTAQVLLAADTASGGTKELKVLSIKSPKSKEPVNCEPQIKIKGSTININENSGIAASVYIDNAYKGEWTLHLNNDASIVAKVFIFNPFPWHWVVIAAALAILIILALMWLLRIPPVRYRKKLIPGNLTVSVDNGSNEMPICDNEPIVNIIKKGKYLKRGNITLGTILGNKAYKDIIFKYVITDDEFDPETLDIVNEGSGTFRGSRLYPEGQSVISLNPETNINIEWLN